MALRTRQAMGELCGHQAAHTQSEVFHRGMGIEATSHCCGSVAYTHSTSPSCVRYLVHVQAFMLQEEVGLYGGVFLRNVVLCVHSTILYLVDGLQLDFTCVHRRSSASSTKAPKHRRRYVSHATACRTRLPVEREC